jgi:hypothetical protein
MTASTKNPPAKAAQDASLDAIPMKKSSPLMIVAIVGAVVLIGGVIFVSSGKKKTVKAADVAAAGSGEVDPFAGMTPEERKHHIEITRKSLQQVAEQEAAAEAKKKAEEEAKKAEEAAKAPSGGNAPSGGGEPVAAKEPSGDTPPAKKVPTAAAKKKMDDLDKLGSDITGKLGK